MSWDNAAHAAADVSLTCGARSKCQVTLNDARLFTLNCVHNNKAGCRMMASAIHARSKRKIPEKTRWYATPSGTGPACENPGAKPPGIEPGSSWWFKRARKPLHHRGPLEQSRGPRRFIDGKTARQFSASCVKATRELKRMSRSPRAGRCRWSAGFLGDLSFPLSFHSGAAPRSPQPPSSAPKTSSLLRAAQISSLTLSAGRFNAYVLVFETERVYFCRCGGRSSVQLQAGTVSWVGVQSGVTAIVRPIQAAAPGRPAPATAELGRSRGSDVIVATPTSCTHFVMVGARPCERAPKNGSILTGDWRPVAGNWVHTIEEYRGETAGYTANSSCTHQQNGIALANSMSERRLPISACYTKPEPHDNEYCTRSFKTLSVAVLHSTAAEDAQYTQYMSRGRRNGGQGFGLDPDFEHETYRSSEVLINTPAQLTCRVKNEEDATQDVENGTVSSKSAVNDNVTPKSAGDDMPTSAKRKCVVETYANVTSKSAGDGVSTSCAEIDHETSKSAGDDDVPTSAKRKYVAETYSMWKKKNINVIMYRKPSEKSDAESDYSEDPNDIVGRLRCLVSLQRGGYLAVIGEINSIVDGLRAEDFIE
ncbi:hypothetical protein PR048_018078 [Dryococelus australis]|uniref:Uncharacterized protein n=1 Tax=Dryococelus australis TaxID=614101 RepID=A0ABQ9HB92_9NEOP|nr:hypothetical protein PR048_018078 [Dryococelus australis]